MHILNAAIGIAQALAAAADDLFEVVGSALGSGFIAEFVRSESGEVSPKQGFPVAWTGGLLIAAAVVLGAPDTARAGACSAQGGSCTADWQCASFCAHKNCTDLFWCDADYDICYCQGVHDDD